MTEEAPVSNVLTSTLTELESQRKAVADLKINSFVFIGAGLLLFILGFFLTNLFLAGAIPGLAALIFGFVKLSKGNRMFSEYRHEFKQKVIAVALKSIDQSLEIDYHTGLSEGNFVASQLFTKEPDRYSSQDQILGTAGKTRFGFSEVHAEYKTETQTKNGRRVEWHEIFKGIIFCADFNKHFKGITVVRPKDFGSSIGAWISSNIPVFSSNSRELVKLENPDFNNFFVTYSTDQVEARYILTPAMMERLCELEGKSKYTISVSFIDTYMYMAFPLNKDYFEPPQFKTLLDRKSLNEDLDVIRFMYGIIEELDLNTRIWGKQ